ncbi:MAG: hypothetical protein KDH88_03120 [Chromatiales bacterium]|nr:hypothetical protein [Chromatiales bacterium]
MTKLLSIALGSVLLAGVGISAQAADANHAIEAAKAAQKQAALVGGEWRDTGAMIKEAEAAAAAGDVKKATHLAEMATAQGRMGYEQAMGEQKKQFPPSYMN